MDTRLFGIEKPYKLLLKLAPPVMLAQLIQALYNIIDSFVLGQVSDTALTALSIVYPLQLFMIALAVGTGVGVNAVIDHYYGIQEEAKAKEVAGMCTLTAVVLWFVFALLCYFIMPAFATWSTSSPLVIEDVIVYGRIVCVFSFGLFLESLWTKVLQANGDMKRPMIAQIAGAIVNIILDLVFIFPCGMGVMGAAVATVIGQAIAAVIVMFKGFYKSPNLKVYPKHLLFIYKMGLPNIIMQSAYTLYIFGLNLILATFSDAAVTVLGLYYKWQAIFFIPLGSLQTCIVPIVAYNYAGKNISQCRQTMKACLIIGAVLMAVGTIFFEAIPYQMLQAFSHNRDVLEIGTIAFRIVGISFVPLAGSLLFPVFFEAVGKPIKSTLLTIIRTVVLFVPLAYLFSRSGLNYFWITFPVSDSVTAICGFVFYYFFVRKENNKANKQVSI